MVEIQKQGTHCDLYKECIEGEFLSGETMFLLFTKHSSTLKTVKVQAGLELLEQSNNSLSVVKIAKKIKMKKNSYLIVILFQEIFKRDHEIQKGQFLLNFTQIFDIAVWTKSHS